MRPELVEAEHRMVVQREHQLCLVVRGEPHLVRTAVDDPAESDRKRLVAVVVEPDDELGQCRERNLKPNDLDHAAVPPAHRLSTGYHVPTVLGGNRPATTCAQAAFSSEAC